jgi:hypothetical protein
LEINNEIYIIVYNIFFILLFNVSFSVAAESVKIAAIFAKTGKAALGNTPFNGVRLAVEELNQQGGKILFAESYLDKTADFTFLVIRSFMTQTTSPRIFHQDPRA